MENYRLDVRNLHKRFPGVYAIKGVSFQVASGDVYKRQSMVCGT